MHYRIVENKENKNTGGIKTKLYLSDGFKDILNKITRRGSSSISSELLKIDGNDDYSDFDVTLIDRTGDDDVVTYLRSNRLKRHIDNGGNIKDAWNIRGRTETRIGRLIRRIFGTKYSQSSIEKFVNKYKAVVRSEKDIKNFDLVSGNDIEYWYLYKRYNSNRGTLGGSCMQGRECQKYFGIYVNNPNRVRLLILKTENGEKLRGRALVWNCTKPDITFMDRIYTNDDADINLFVEYARSHGWAYKKRQGYRYDDVVMPDGETQETKLIVELDDVNYRRYPYMDTFRYLYDEIKVVSNHQISKYKGQYAGEVKTLIETNGYYEEFDEDYEPEYVTDWHGNEINENDAVWCEYEEVYCLATEAIYVSKGEHGRGKYFLPNSKLIRYSHYSDSYYHKDDVVYSDFLKDWIYKRYAVKMYLDKDKTKWVWNHRLSLHEDMGKIGDDYFVNSILYRDQYVDPKTGKVKLGDYHFIDEEFKNLPVQPAPEDDYFTNVPPGTRIDD